MKNAGDIAKQQADEIFGTEDRLVHCYASHKGYKFLDEPKFANQMECEFCGFQQGYTCKIDKDTRAWICGRVCPASKLPKKEGGTQVLLKPQRSLEWPLFCENNGIGDLHHDVKFELIDQNQGKIEYLKKFCLEPKGIILMYGPPGSGKTYASMGLCELFTRKNISCQFFTHRSLATQWLASFRENSNQLFVSRLEKVEMLVIDDFGTSDPSEKFMTFMMDLINARIQWKNRGTVITTNLTPEKLSEVCGDALSDRLRTGQKFQFKGDSRRSKVL